MFAPTGYPRAWHPPWQGRKPHQLLERKAEASHSWCKTGGGKHLGGHFFKILSSCPPQLCDQSHSPPNSYEEALVLAEGQGEQSTHCSPRWCCAAAQGEIYGLRKNTSDIERNSGPLRWGHSVDISPKLLLQRPAID